MLDAVLIVLVPAIGVFIIALFGNLISFGNRYVNALVTALVLVAAWLVWAFLVPGVDFPVLIVLVAAGSVFVADLIGNLITFSNRFTNALATAIVFAALFVGALYAMSLVVGGGPFELGG